jgi:hypothetical protein
LSDLGEDTPTAGSSARIRPLARNQLPVPSQQCVRRHDRRDLTQGLPTQSVRSYSESPPVVIGQPQPPPTNLPAEEAILIDQIGERLPLAAIEPAGDGEEQPAKDRHVDHEWKLISLTGFTRPMVADPIVGQYGMFSHPSRWASLRFTTTTLVASRAD